MPFTVGERTTVRGENGTIRFVGTTKFAPGEWIGIELDNPRGRNDGSVQGVKYFNCQSSGNYGVFVRPSLIGDSTSDSDPGAFSAVDAKVVVRKLQQKLKSAVDEIAKGKHTITELNERLQLDESRLEELEIAMERSTVDQEHLKKHNTELISSLTTLQLRYDELNTDYSILHEELEIHKELEKAVSSQSQSDPMTSEDYKVLLQHNKKLELAITSLKKSNEDTETKHLEIIDHLNKKLSEMEVLNSSYAELRQQLTSSHSTIEYLKEQLEMMSESASIVENLTVENEQLNSKVAQLSNSVNELTELHELDKNIEENHQIIRAEFEASIKALESEVASGKEQVSRLQRHNDSLMRDVKDLESKVNKSSSKLELDVEDLVSDLGKYQAQNNRYSCLNLKLERYVESLLHVQARLVPENYKRQIEIMTEIENLKSSIFAILYRLKSLSPSCMKAMSSLAFEKLLNTLSSVNLGIQYRGKVLDFELLSAGLQEVSSSIEEVLQLQEESDWLELDLTYWTGSVSLCRNWTQTIECCNSTRALYLFSNIESELKSQKEIAAILVSRVSSHSSYGVLRGQNLQEFMQAMIDLLTITAEKQIFIRSKLEEELNQVPSLNLKDFEFSEVLLQQFNLLESNVNLMTDELLGEASYLDFSAQTKFYESVATQLKSVLVFRERDSLPLFEKIREAQGDTSGQMSQIVSELRSKALQRDQKIQDLKLEIELLEKNTRTLVSTKDADIEASRLSIAELQEKIESLKVQNNNLLSANENLEAQILMMRTAESEQTQYTTLLFEDLIARKQYTKEMALVDEIQLLQTVLRRQDTLSRDQESKELELWLHKPLPLFTSHRYAFSQGLSQLELARKTRKDAFALSQKITGRKMRRFQKS